MGGGDVELAGFFTLYEEAFARYRSGQYAEAWDLLLAFQRKKGIRILLCELLKAYILRAQKKYVSEIACLKALVHDFADCDDKKHLADAYSLLGEAQRMLGESREAVASFTASARIEPDAVKKLTEVSNAIFSANAIADWEAGQMQELYSLYRHYLGALSIVPYPRVDWQHKKIRLGYLSADLRNHAVGQFVKPFFFAFAQESFEVYVYQLNKDEDLVTRELQRAPVVWRNLTGKNWAGIAAAVHADEIDILLELGGHTACNALPVLAYHPAYIQISGIGYFNSIGLEDCDGFLSDVYCSPEPASPYFTEELLILPHTHFCYQPYKVFPEVSPPPVAKNDYITFGSFNNFAKVNDEMLLIWREILLRVPGSRLLLKHQLLGTAEGREYTLRRLSKLGLPAGHIDLRSYSANYLQEYGAVDIALDTEPYTGGLTTCEALYMGVPVVTLAGNRHGARFGLSFLSNVGLGELAAKSREEYVDIAVALAEDRELLAALRQNLRQMLQSSPLMNPETYMEDLENLYCHLLNKYCRNRNVSVE
ncbi:Predicted O-linked N-acetylglucosamine transferase, SPINDLY family [Selenomonas ruminantium]|uniref:protein O-GlcNAc transferase n=1 Tax=Selenomonas ruminantium TaxID=971 RepID=A0A1M6QYT8_SELRU|nr:hypothetical protein [Selenomonas ruminantium]SHK25374.1 Predicted O-linked N-acetylglucosamine transferase, SPINDLY family [Selenomonas ruminantium]